MSLILLVIVALAVLGAVLGLAAYRLRGAVERERAVTAELSARLKRVEEETERLQTIRRDFVANISHELRTPLASIKLLAETLQDGALDDRDAALNFAQKIGAETDHLIAMAQELLELARLEAAPAPRPRPLDSADLVTRAVDRMRDLARQKGVALRAEIPPQLPHVWADDEQIGRAFVNLIGNAIAFTPAYGSVAVSACADGAGGQDVQVVLFSVSDTGPGIPPGEEERIFERFYKLDTARHGGGSGLGLSITRHIVEAQGGRIWARNREDTGACFSFSLPVAVERPAARAAGH